MLVTLGSPFLGEVGREVACELLKVRRHPPWQFRSQRLGCRRVGHPRMLIRFLLKPFNRMCRLIGDFRASGGKLLLPLFERQPPLRGNRPRSGFPRGRLNLLLGVCHQPRNLTRQL